MLAVAMHAEHTAKGVFSERAKTLNYCSYNNNYFKEKY